MTHSTAPDPARTLVARLRQALEARAAGLWRLRGDRLVLAAFIPAPDLDPEVAGAFEAATRSVALDQVGLGIVQAARAAAPAVATVERLPADAGSARWLRDFGARRSVAVPLIGPDGGVTAVLSVALEESEPPGPIIARQLQEQAASWLASEAGSGPGSGPGRTA